jgi:hypothetical protein
LTTFSVPIFGAVFEVHFGVHFGLFLDSDLLVLRGFLSVEGGFWAFFRRVFDRTFEHDFATFHLGRVVVRY